MEVGVDRAEAGSVGLDIRADEGHRGTNAQMAEIDVLIFDLEREMRAESIFDAAADHIAAFYVIRPQAALEQLAAPNLVIGLILYLGAGIISRLMPTMQIFFIMLSPQLLISFFILMVSFGAIMLWYLDYFKTTMGAFLAP